MSLRFLKLLVLDCLLNLLLPLLLASVYTMLWLPGDWRRVLREKAQCLLLEKQGSLESQQEEGVRQGDLLLLVRDFEFVLSFLERKVPYIFTPLSSDSEKS